MNKIIHYKSYDLKSMRKPDVIAVTHEADVNTQFIELTITDSDGNQVLVTPFPLTVHVNPSILDDAQVTPESQGTVPELLEAAEEALDLAGIESGEVNANGTITFTRPNSLQSTTSNSQRPIPTQVLWSSATARCTVKQSTRRSIEGDTNVRDNNHRAYQPSRHTRRHVRRHSGNQ